MTTLESQNLIRFLYTSYQMLALFLNELPAVFWRQEWFGTKYEVIADRTLFNSAREAIPVKVIKCRDKAIKPHKQTTLGPSPHVAIQKFQKIKTLKQLRRRIDISEKSRVDFRPSHFFVARRVFSRKQNEFL